MPTCIAIYSYFLKVCSWVYSDPLTSNMVKQWLIY